VDDTHLCLNTVNTHSGTTDIEQLGNNYWDGGRFNLFRPNVAAHGTHKAHMTWADNDNNLIMSWPASQSDPAPWDAFAFGIEPLTCYNSDTLVPSGNCTWVNSAASSHILYKSFDRTATLFDMSEATDNFLMKMGNAINFSGQFQASSDAFRIYGGGTNTSLILFGVQTGTGTSGVIRFRNNTTDNTETMTVDTSAAQKVTVTNLSVSGTGLAQLGSTTVSALPSAASNAGAMIRVSDSTALATEGQTCVGSSTNVALAFSNGSVWKCF
jgi:hypothetical protein